MTLSSFYSDSFENFSVKEIGLKLKPSERFRIRKRLSLLEQKAPAFSTISLNYQQSECEDNEQTAELSIQGGGHKFQSRASGSSPLETYLKVEREIEEQLLTWKRERFLSKGIGLTPNGDRLQLTGGF